MEEWESQVRHEYIWGDILTSGVSSRFRVNVVGLVFFTIALIPLLKNSSEKRVVNIASFLGDLRYIEVNPEVNCSSGSATKAAVTVANAKFHVECGESHSLRLYSRLLFTTSRFKSEGFIFLALNPGFVNAAMTEHMGAQVRYTSADNFVRSDSSDMYR